ncbi:aggregation promoting factor surface protein [Nicoliella spurrieriana]|uniref:Aggregation promoting factor surface protein n=1 Tax=Nicoliella spurrieriana TaxID=2925830 RepID=A0A976RT49_9LACO|nr:aggregation promoting factor surface protein [Nicoliella spurrieriana]UQS87397.1 aggregation promoting factor surface protein [Nicoliella spurrieriana]
MLKKLVFTFLATVSMTGAFIASNEASEPTANAATSNLSKSDAAAKKWIAWRESKNSYTASNGRYYGKYQLGIGLLHGNYSAANQEKVADNYVKSRYGTWSNAKRHWLTHNWY